MNPNDRIMEMEYDGMSLLFQCVDPEIPMFSGTVPGVAAQPSPTMGTVPSGFRDNTIKKLPKTVFSDVGMLAKKASEEFRRGLEPSENLPKEVELEFSFAITTTGKILILSGETEFGVKLKLTWK